jgi:hypothetical protein
MTMCHMRLAVLCLLLSALFPSLARAQAPAGVLVLKVTPQDTSIKFFVKSSVALEGNFNKLDATLTYPSTDYKSGVLDLEIYAESVNTGSGRKDGKLKSQEFFNVEQDPLPLVMFTPHSWRAKRTGRSKYGLLATKYLAAFRAKWIVGPPPQDEELLGSSDVQSLADMENSYDSVRRMRLVPFGLTEVTALAAPTLAPLLPWTLTVYSLDPLAGRVLKMMF